MPAIDLRSVWPRPGRPRGVLILGEGPGASWILGDEGTPDNVFVLVIARESTSIARRSALRTKWQPLGSGWS